MIDEHKEVDAKTEGESNDHTKVLGPNNNINKKEAIVPEEELMTENTSDLKRMLEATQYGRKRREYADRLFRHSQQM